MIELPYKKKFESVPEIELDQLVNYFNLEFGFSGNTNKQYRESDFKYLGIFEVNGYEIMYWSVKEKDLCATLRPYEETYIIEMDSGPPDCARLVKSNNQK